MRTILLVDDDDDDRGIFVETLTFLDKTIQCWTATDGQNAMQFLLYEAVVLPDLIFLDLNMPRMNGHEFLKAAKNHPALRNIPIIIYTTSSNPADMKKTSEQGASDYVTKPSDSKSLYQKLIAILNKHLVSAYHHS